MVNTATHLKVCRGNLRSCRQAEIAYYQIEHLQPHKSSFCHLNGLTERDTFSHVCCVCLDWKSVWWMMERVRRGGGWGQIDWVILGTIPFVHESMQGRAGADRAKPPSGHTTKGFCVALKVLHQHEMYTIGCLSRRQPPSCSNACHMNERSVCMIAAISPYPCLRVKRKGLWCVIRYTQSWNETVRTVWYIWCIDNKAGGMI